MIKIHVSEIRSAGEARQPLENYAAAHYTVTEDEKSHAERVRQLRKNHE